MNDETSSKQPSYSGKNGRRDEEMAGSKDNFSFKLQSDRLRWSFEDPMHNYLKLQKIRDKEERVKELQSMLESSSSSSEESSDSSPKKRKRSRSDRSHRKHKKRKKKKFHLKTEKNIILKKTDINRAHTRKGKKIKNMIIIANQKSEKGTERTL